MNTVWIPRFSAGTQVPLPYGKSALILGFGKGRRYLLQDTEGPIFTIGEDMLIEAVRAATEGEA